jgi:hypothetical protein
LIAGPIRRVAGHKGKNMETPFIIVFRPHQMPATAFIFQSEADFLQSHQNYGKPSDEFESIESPTYDDAIEDAGRDLSNLTRLDSAEEVQKYLSDRNYCGHHNKGLGVVRKCAEQLGWISANEE